MSGFHLPEQNNREVLAHHRQQRGPAVSIPATDAVLAAALDATNIGGRAAEFIQECARANTRLTNVTVGEEKRCCNG